MLFVEQFMTLVDIQIWKVYNTLLECIK